MTMASPLLRDNKHTYFINQARTGFLTLIGQKGPVISATDATNAVKEIFRQLQDGLDQWFESIRSDPNYCDDTAISGVRRAAQAELATVNNQLVAARAAVQLQQAELDAAKRRAESSAAAVEGRIAEAVRRAREEATAEAEARQQQREAEAARAADDARRAAATAPPPPAGPTLADVATLRDELKQQLETITSQHIIINSLNAKVGPAQVAQEKAEQKVAELNQRLAVTVAEVDKLKALLATAQGVEAAATEAAEALRTAAKSVTAAMETLVRDLAEHTGAVRASLRGFSDNCEQQQRKRLRTESEEPVAAAGSSKR